MPRVPVPRPHTTAEPAKEDVVDDENSMSMDEAYALALAGRQRAPPPEEEEMGAGVATDGTLAQGRDSEEEMEGRGHGWVGCTGRRW
ncbi:hypothetical protein ZWY2020_034832 [Hordeum vulgare]|nr:hypothetical protein ZWY2020_034832 [Hordeum vulgare]